MQMRKRFQTILLAAGLSAALLSGCVYASDTGVTEAAVEMAADEAEKAVSEAVETAATEAEKAQASARALFSSGSAADMPETTLTEDNLKDGKIDIMGILVAAGLCPSRSDARRAVQQGGVQVNGEKVTDIGTEYAPEDINKEEFIIRRGKKNYRKITFAK
jgi:tyrosyl-tRNA synthetase